VLEACARELINIAGEISDVRWRRAEREGVARRRVDIDLAMPQILQLSLPGRARAPQRVTCVHARLPGGVTLRVTEGSPLQAVHSCARLLAAVADCNYELLGPPSPRTPPGPDDVGRRLGASQVGVVAVPIGEPDGPYLTLEGDTEGVWRLYGRSEAGERRLGCGMSPAMAFPPACGGLAAWNAARSLSTVDRALQRLARKSVRFGGNDPRPGPSPFTLWEDVRLIDGRGERLERVGVEGSPTAMASGGEVIARLGSLATVRVRRERELDALREALWLLKVFLTGFSEQDPAPGEARSFAACHGPILSSAFGGSFVGAPREVGTGNRRWELDYRKPDGDVGVEFGPGPLDPLLFLLPELFRW